MMQLPSLGSRHNCSFTPLVSLYHIGYPLASSIGPTSCRPAAPFRCAGGGVNACEATNAPDAAIANAATPTVKVRRLRVIRVSLFIAFSSQVGRQWRKLVAVSYYLRFRSICDFASTITVRVRGWENLEDEPPMTPSGAWWGAPASPRILGESGRSQCGGHPRGRRVDGVPYPT